MFLIRECAGWALMLIALYLIRIGLTFAMDLESPRLVESAVVTFTGLSVMRVGVLLIRISTAARICQWDAR